MPSDNNSLIELVGRPDFEVWPRDCTETPYGSQNDDGVELIVHFHTSFSSSDDFRTVHRSYRLPLSEFSDKQVVAEMLAAVGIPAPIISSDLGSTVEEVFVAGQNMACHRRPWRTQIRLIVTVFLPLSRLPNDDDSETDDDDDDDDDDEDDDYEDYPIWFVPASEESIEGLEKSRVSNDEIESGMDCCSVCLEEVSVDSEVSRLPCSHRFHADCIVKWLSTSKFCPMCRFEMPS